MTTWAELKAGDAILDKDGKMWTVRADADVADRHYCQVAVTDGTRYVNVKHRNSAEAPTVDLPPEPLKEHVAEVIAIETARETTERTSEGPHVYPLAEDLGGLKLRSHLYLIHGYTLVGQLSDVDEMLAAHTKMHEANQTEVVHTHEETA